MSIELYDASNFLTASPPVNYEGMKEERHVIIPSPNTAVDIDLVCAIQPGALASTQREKRECTSGKLPCALAYASRSSADTPCVRRPGNARESDYCVQVISALGKSCKHKYVHFLRTLVAPAHTLVHGRFTTCTHAYINCIPAYQHTKI